MRTDGRLIVCHSEPDSLHFLSSSFAVKNTKQLKLGRALRAKIIIVRHCTRSSLPLDSTAQKVLTGFVVVAFVSRVVLGLVEGLSSSFFCMTSIQLFSVPPSPFFRHEAEACRRVISEDVSAIFI